MDQNEQDIKDVDNVVEDKNNGAGLSFNDTLSVLAKAISNGDITSHQARQMRNDIGANQSYFTRNQSSKAKIKRGRKLQKKARKAQRGK